MPTPGALRAAIYCRISLARFDDTLKVDDQEAVCRQLAVNRGWTVAPHHVFKDNSKSAWRRDRKRPGWDAMLEAVRNGEVDAIVVYHGDRLVRQMSDLEALIDLADTKGIRLASPTGERDLDNADDRYILRIEAAGNTREVDATSRRLKRHYDRLAEQGIVRLGGRGGRAFGFEPDGLTVREADAALIREVARRIISGEPVGAIARDLNARGFTTTTGGPWDHGALKKLMVRPRLAGLVSHHGRIVGPSAWPAILDRGTWETVTAILERKAEMFGYASSARRYLLTGLAECGTCRAKLYVRHNTRPGLTGYGCINRECARKVHRAIHHLDPYVIGATLALLNDSAVRERMQPAASVDTAPLVADLNEQMVNRERWLVAAADDVKLGPDLLRVTISRIDKRIEQLRAQITAAQRPTVLDGLWGIDVSGWGLLGLHRQRAAIGALMRVTVFASGRRGPGFDPKTVKLEQL
ncbi:recombinase family protein [Micromonospora zamorensis]|uniref:recombinase family protein n=1 Tax=Micromonospora zamorensis TaxID=709883 RepID=UPI00352A3D9A|nr:recombinase family protein [Micromonospora zamorensis]